MSAYSRKKRAGKLPKPPAVRRSRPPASRPSAALADFPRVRHQRPLLSAAEALQLERAERDRRFYEGLMRRPR